MRRLRRRRLVAEMNVVPYIDVMLVLLVIFMVTTPLLRTGVEVALPQGEADPVNTEPPFVLSIDAAGNWYASAADVPEKAQSAEQVSALLIQQLARNPNVPVMVAADKQVPYDWVMRAMLHLQAAGASSIGLLSDPGGA